MRKPDEIMAEYLLKGGKMLAKSCSVCYSPLFEHKGETFCVVCREQKESETVSGKDLNTTEEMKIQAIDTEPHKRSENTDLCTLFEETISILLKKIQNEPDSQRVLTLMQAVHQAAESYSFLYPE